MTTRAAPSAGSRSAEGRVVPFVALGAMTVGILVLTGWALDVDVLRRLTPFDDQPRVKANTALGLIAAASSLLLWHRQPVSRPRRRLAQACSGLVCSIGILTLVEHVFGVDVGIDQLLVHEELVTAARTPHPGRMATNSALAFVLLGAALLTFDLRRGRHRPANALAVMVAAFGFMALFGIVLGVDGVPFFSQYANMAFVTAIAFILLAAGVIGARRDSGVMEIVAGRGAASAAVRGLLPAVLILPLVIGYLRLEAQRRGLINLEFGTWILVASLTFSFAAVVWAFIRRLHKAELQAREDERRVVAAREAAERANAAKSDFISRMSHELRTPLNSILGFSQLMQMDGLRDDQSEHVQHIVRSGRDLLGLINEILDISRIEAGKLSMSTEPVPIDATLDDAVGSVAPTAAQKGVDVTHHGRVPGVFVSADQQRVRQVLLNLLSNAIKYGRGSVRVAASVDGDVVLIRVTDDGHVASDHLESMFEPFERGPAEGGDEEGTGLGLALARRLVELMHGTLAVESTPERGTCFTVELPRAEAPVAVVPEQPQPDDERPHRTGLRIVYIEDNVANLQLVDAVVTRRGGVLLAAVDGGTGVTLASTERPDLILLDLNLPDMSGLDVLRELRARPETRQIPIVMLTADATASSRHRAGRLGVDAYLSKPLEIDHFLATIDELVVPSGPTR